MAVQQRLKALGRKLDRLDAAESMSPEFWMEDFAGTWEALVQLNNPPENGPAAHRQRLEVLRTAADLHRKLLRALPALRQPVELEIMLFVSGLLQVGSMLLELLSEALDTPPPGCQPPPDQLCLAAGAWTAALLGPATAMLRRRDDMSTPLALAGSARPVKLLLTRLEMSAGKPFAAALRRGAARPQLVAATLHELIGAAGYVHELRGFGEVHPTGMWKDSVQAVLVLYSPGWDEALQLVLRARPAAGQEAAALILRFVRHAALEAAASAAPADDARWRHVASCAYGAGRTTALRPEVDRFMQGSEGASVQRAIVRFLAALPRKPPAGKTAADHAALLCLSANAALQLQIAGMPDRPIAGSAAVVALLLRADVTVAVADVLTAAAERCTAALDENTALAASGPLQELRAQEVWRDAAQAWHLSHVGACIMAAVAVPLVVQQAAAARTPEQRAESWQAAGKLAAAAERLLRLLPKLPRGTPEEASALSPASFQTEAALGLGRGAVDAARVLAEQALLQPRQAGQREQHDTAAAEAGPALAALAYTLAKRALLWADSPVGQGAEAAMEVRRRIQGRVTHAPAAADRSGRGEVVSLLNDLLVGGLYSLGAAGKAEQGNSLAEYQKTWPLVQAMDAAAQSLVAGVPEAQAEATRLHELATHFAPGPNSQTLRPDPRNPAPPELLGLLLMQERPCYNPRCRNLAGASEAQLKGKLCTGCRVARFCCMDCSKAVWREHKTACKFMQASKSEQAAEAPAAGEGAGGSSASA